MSSSGRLGSARCEDRGVIEGIEALAREEHALFEQDARSEAGTAERPASASSRSGSISSRGSLDLA